MCIMSCPGGNCRLHCDGTKCKRECAGGGCDISGSGQEVTTPRPTYTEAPKPSGNAPGTMSAALALFVPGIAYILSVYEY